MATEIYTTAYGPTVGEWGVKTVFYILCQKYFCLSPCIASSVLSIQNYVKVGHQIYFRISPRNV
jgi:hypothetical protein